jgi:hypothetical protein
MDEPAHPPTAPPPSPGSGNSLLWFLGLFVLVAWQGWMTLSLFGPDRPWERVCDDEPILSGRHPLHLYHGWLGAQALLARGKPCCFDPCFQAGYPKTPVFDGGSRPAELCLLLAGGTYQPAAYKIGLALWCAVVPLVLAAAARGAGLSRAAAWLATFLGLLVWWGAPARSVLEAGNLDLLLAAPAAVLQAGLVLRFDRAPGLLTWQGILASGAVGWFAHPLFFALLLPLVLIFLLSVANRHRLVWHLALLAGLLGAVAVNAFWLIDWVSYLWIREPLHLEAHLLPHRTFHTLWNALFWGEPADRALALALVAAAVVGAGCLNQSRQRPAARFLGLGAVGLLVLAVGGAVSEPLAGAGGPVLLLPALLFAVVPAAHGLLEGFRLAARWTGGPFGAAAVSVVMVVLVTVPAHRHVATLLHRGAGTCPLGVGLSPDRAALLATLCEHTTPEARILWEDCSGPAQASRWTALLPVLTERAYVGGLDPDASIEHAYADLTDGLLAGRPLKQWSDKELADFCQRYNIGWLVCWSPGAVERFRTWPATEVKAALQDGTQTGYLFQLQRSHSFALIGQAQWLRADCRRIALGDVVPDPKEGVVLLSLHYQSGLQVSPGRIQIERALDPSDPIPFVRLRLPGPVSRLTLTWEGR